MTSEIAPETPPSASARPLVDSEAQPPRTERQSLDEEQVQGQGRARELVQEPGKGAGDEEQEPRELRAEVRAGMPEPERGPFHEPSWMRTSVVSPVGGAGLKRSATVDRSANGDLDDGRVTVPKPSRIAKESPSTVSRVEIVSPAGGVAGQQKPQPIGSRRTSRSDEKDGAA